MPIYVQLYSNRSTVRVVKSNTSGTGKSLYIQRVGSQLNEIVKKSDAASRQLSSSVDTEMIVTISMQGTSVNQDEVVKALLPFEKKREEAFPRIYHFDIAATVSIILTGCVSVINQPIFLSCFLF